MPLYVHTCFSQVSGIAMMINCVISVLLGLYGSGQHGSTIDDDELAKCPMIYKYFRILMLVTSILFNTGRFIYECIHEDVMLITVLFRLFGSIIQLMEHLYLCQHFEFYFTKLEGESLFWTRGLFSLGSFCGLGIFSGLEGINGYGKYQMEHIFWSLTLSLLIWGGTIWGRWQPNGLGRAKYLACRGSLALCFLTTLILVIADPTANGVVNRIVIGSLFLIGTIIVHYLHRRDLRDSALIDVAAIKENSRRSQSVAVSAKIYVESPPEDVENSMIGRNNSTVTDNVVPFAPPPEVIERTQEINNIVPFNSLSSTHSTQPGHIHEGSTNVHLDTEAQTARYVKNTTTASKDRYLTRTMSYEFVSDARRGRLINDMYMSKAMAIVGQVVGWYCFIFVVELCVFAYYVTNYGSSPKVCPTISSYVLPMCQIVVDSIF